MSAVDLDQGLGRFLLDAVFVNPQAEDMLDKYLAVAEELEQVETRLANTLGSEVILRDRLYARLVELKVRLVHYEMAEKGYPVILDWSTFRLRNPETGWPSFMIVHHSNSVLEIGASIDGVSFHMRSTNHGSSGHYSYQLGQAFTDQFIDVGEALIRMSKPPSFFRDGVYYKLSAALSPDLVVPDATKQAIAEAKKEFNDQIYLIAEVKEWALSKELVPSIITGDPIVAGQSDGTLWFIDMFDPTPLEEYIAQSFTTYPW